ncbi:MAG TPA: hypothetical protein VGI43_05355 [Mucilaginibacter sp.]|jgi:limonene-1,2-epoxide hydrolase
MTRTIKLFLFLAATIFAASTIRAQAQTAAPIHQKDFIGENPTADADIKTVSDYTNWIVAGDADKAKGLLAAGFKGYGPAPIDSVTADQEIAAWQENYKNTSNRKVDFVTETFRVLSGNLQGNWVSTWGDYTFTESGKTVKFPFQCTYHVTNGKIDISRIYYDRTYILMQLGYTLTPPPAAK